MRLKDFGHEMNRSAGKILVFVILFAYLLFPLSVESYEQEAKMSSVRLAALTATEMAIDKLAERRILNAKTKCKHAILSNTSRHKTPNRSKTELKQVYEGLLKQDLVRTLKEIHKQFNPKPDELDKWFTLDWLENYVDTKFGDRRDQAIEDNCTEYYNDVFQLARDDAVDAQGKALAKDIAPQECEVDVLASSSWAKEAWTLLRDSLLDRMTIQLDQPLLEEVENKAEDIAKEALENAKQQYQQQLRKVNEAVPPKEALTKNQLEDTIRSSIQAGIDMTKRKDPDKKVYRIFDTVAKTISERATQLEKERFASFIQGRRISVRRDSLRDLISSNLLDHKMFNESLSKVRLAHWTKFAEDSVQKYSEKVPSDSKREQFKRQLEKYAESDPTTRQAIERTLDDNLKNPLQAIRATLAEDQIKRHFPLVASRGWVAKNATMIGFVTDKNKGLIDPIRISTFEECISLEGINETGEPYEDTTLLEESDKKLLNLCGVLITEARNAWNGQIHLFMRYEPEIAEEIGQGPNKRTVEGWTDYFKKKIESDWAAESSKEIPLPATKKYILLFTYVVDKIRQVVKDKLKEPMTEIAQPKKFPIPGISVEPESPTSKKKGDGPADEGGGQNGKMAAVIQILKKAFPWLLLALALLLLYLLWRRFGRRRDGRQMSFRSFVLRIYVHNLENSLRFYEKFRGIRIVTRDKDSVLFRLGRSYIQLRTSPEDVSVQRRVSISFLTEGLDEIRKHLESQGLLTDDLDQYHDPDGMVITVGDIKGYKE